MALPPDKYVFADYTISKDEVIRAACADAVRFNPFRRVVVFYDYVVTFDPQDASVLQEIAQEVVEEGIEMGRPALWPTPKHTQAVLNWTEFWENDFGYPRAQKAPWVRRVLRETMPRARELEAKYWYPESYGVRTAECFGVRKARGEVR